MTKPSDNLEGVTTDDDGALDLTDVAQMELLRAAIVQHGLRIAAIDARLEQQINDLHAVRGVVAQINARMQRLIEKLGGQ